MASQRGAFIGIFVVTWLSLLTIGTTLPVLPKYVTGPIGGGDIAVGVVAGAFAATGLLFRPIAGAFADGRGRKPVVIVGSLLTAVSGALLFVPAGIPGLIVSRFVLGAGEGMVYTAGAAWIIDITPVHIRGRILGLYGLSIWGGLSLGPPVGELILSVSDFEYVWAFVTVLPLIGMLAAQRLPDNYSPPAPAQISGLSERFRRLIAREALGPGSALALAVIGYATTAAFIVLHLDDRGIGHGAFVFTIFATMVVLTRIVGGGVADRLGGARTAAASTLILAIGLLTLGFSGSLPVALIGATAMGLGIGPLFPSLALMVLERVPEERRGAAMGTFTAFFDVGFGIGAPLAGIAVAVGGYGLAFVIAALLALTSSFVSLQLGRRRRLPIAATEGGG